MLKAAIGRALRVGVRSEVLIARARLLRRLGLLASARSRGGDSCEQIFFSFPYHSVGDPVLSLVLLDRMHERWPGAAIDVAVGATTAPLFRSIAYVRRVFELPRAKARYAALVAYREIENATRLYQREISPTAYDLAVAPRWDAADSFLAAHLAYLTGARVRCGYSGAAGGGSTDADRFLTTAAMGGNNEHESLRYLRLLRRCGLEEAGEDEEHADALVPSLPIKPLVSVAEARRASGETVRPPGPGAYAVLSPGATSARRMWPLDRFAEVARFLLTQYGLRSVILGGAMDLRLCDELADQIGAGTVSMAGRTDILEMLDLLAGAQLFLGNDSGPAHLAGGVGLRTLVVSPFPRECTLDHPNSPRRFRPAGPRVRVLQPEQALPPCRRLCERHQPHCILQVSAAEGIGAACEALAGAGQSSGRAETCAVR